MCVEAPESAGCTSRAVTQALLSELVDQLLHEGPRGKRSGGRTGRTGQLAYGRCSVEADGKALAEDGSEVPGGILRHGEEVDLGIPRDGVMGRLDPFGPLLDENRTQYRVGVGLRVHDVGRGVDGVPRRGVGRTLHGGRDVGLAVVAGVEVLVELVELAAVVVLVEDEGGRGRRDHLLFGGERLAQRRVGRRVARSVDADGPDVVGRAGQQRLVAEVALSAHAADRNDILARGERRADLALDVVVQVFAQAVVVLAVALVVRLGDDVPDVEHAGVRGVHRDVGAVGGDVGDVEREGVLRRVARSGRLELHLGELGRCAVRCLVVAEGRDVVLGVGLQRAEVDARRDGLFALIGEEKGHGASVELQQLLDELLVAHLVDRSGIAHVDEVGHRGVERLDKDGGAVEGDLLDLEREGLGFGRSLHLKGFAQREVSREACLGVVAGHQNAVLGGGGELTRKGELPGAGVQERRFGLEPLDEGAQGIVGEPLEGRRLEEVAVVRRLLVRRGDLERDALLVVAAERDGEGDGRRGVGVRVGFGGGGVGLRVAASGQERNGGEAGK